MELFIEIHCRLIRNVIQLCPPPCFLIKIVDFNLSPFGNENRKPIIVRPFSWPIKTQIETILEGNKSIHLAAVDIYAVNRTTDNSGHVCQRRKRNNANDGRLVGR
jgi:hypothetical protein